MKPPIELARIIKALEAVENRRYREITLAGKGGHAYTLQARDSTRGDQLVAIKIPKSDIYKDKREAGSDIVDEGYRVAVLGPHENIVRVHRLVSYDQGKRGLVMEFIRGGNLRKAIPSINGHIESSIKIISGVCKALMTAHNHPEPIIHRDVKPENILMDGSTPKLIDFGIATEISNYPLDEVVGSLYYLAPECLKGDGYIPDPRSDLYSLAVVLFELLEGNVPFRAENTTAVINSIQKDPLPALRSELPISLRRIVYKGLQKTPDARYQSAQEMLFDLELFLEFYTNFFVTLEEFEIKLDQRSQTREEKAKKFLFLGEQYLESATETMSGVMAELLSEPQRSQLERPMALLKLASEEIRKALGHGEPIPAPAGGASDLEGADKIARALWAKLVDFDTVEDVPTTPREELDIEPHVAVIEQLLLEAQNIEAAKSSAENLLKQGSRVTASLRVAEVFYRCMVFDHAITICDQALKEYGEHAELFAVRGKALLQIALHQRKDNQKRDALQTLKKAIELGTRDEDAVTSYREYSQSVYS